MSTPAAVGTGSAIALGPQVLSPAVNWAAGWISAGMMPIPSEAESLSISSVIIFLGGGVVWMLATLVRWFFKKHHIIEEVPDEKIINP
jgi:hypothetical protein